MDYKDKKIGFASDLVLLIKKGEKTLTYRLGSKWNFLEPGDTIFVEDSLSKENFGRLKINLKEQTTFGSLPNSRRGHETYKTDGERRVTLEKYYGRHIEDAEPFIIFGFEFIKN